MVVANALVFVVGKISLEFVPDKPLFVYQSYQMPEVCNGLRIVDKFLDRSNFMLSPLIVLLSDAIKKLICSANNQDCSSLISFRFRLSIWFLLLRPFVHPYLGLPAGLLGNSRVLFPFLTHSVSFLNRTG